MIFEDDDDLRARLDDLRRQHRDLDDTLEQIARLGTVDMIQLQRLKREKLRLKDEIAKIENLLLPDIIA